MTRVLALLILLVSALTTTPALAHMGYENTVAKDCCSKDGHECRMADSYYPTATGYVFIAPWNSDDQSSARIKIEVDRSSVKFVDLFPNEPERRGKSHVCASVTKNADGTYTIWAHCGFIPPAKNLTVLPQPFLDSRLEMVKPRFRGASTLYTYESVYCTFSNERTPPAPPM